MCLDATLAAPGGGDRIRTDDPLLAKQVLSRLSYTPAPGPPPTARPPMVGLGRFELPTSRLSGVRSNRLSYRPLDLGPCGACHPATERMTRAARADPLTRIGQTPRAVYGRRVRLPMVAMGRDARTAPAKPGVLRRATK